MKIVELVRLDVADRLKRKGAVKNWDLDELVDVEINKLTQLELLQAISDAMESSHS